jgi:hypothetical protein
VKSSVTKEFRKRLDQLPSIVQEQAIRAYEMWRADPFHSSLQFKRVNKSLSIYSARIGIGHRALAFRKSDHVEWFWIGSHAEYDELLKRL